MLNNCFALEKLDLSGADLSQVTNMSGFAAFTIAANIDFSNITAPTNITNMGAAFRANYCQVMDLRMFDLSHITSFGLIGYQAKATTVYMPSTTVRIDGDSFTNAPNFHIESSTPPTLGGTNAIPKNTGLVIYVPYSADHSILAAYQSATNWSTYASYMQEEPT